MLLSHKANFAELGCGEKKPLNSIDFSISGYSREPRTLRTTHPTPPLRPAPSRSDGVRLLRSRRGEARRRILGPAERTVEQSSVKEKVDIGDEILPAVTSNSDCS
jgi:hypothetical protein